LVWLGVWLSLSGSVVPALACSCAAAPGAGSSYPETLTVFRGRVISITPTYAPGPFGSGFDQVEVQLAVELDDQGRVLKRTRLTAPASTAACGYPFQVGTTYVLFAQRLNDGRLITDSCSATSHSSTSVEVAHWQQDPVPSPVRRPDLVVLIVAAGLAATTMFGIGMVWRRSPRR
jgi:hypothetical protein